MNRRQIALKLVLDQLAWRPDMAKFDDRLILQKTIYLLQHGRVPLGYHYSWYLRGPYCRDLTADAYENHSGSLIGEGWALDPSVEEAIQRLKLFFHQTLLRQDAVREFEKLGSVLFVIKTKQAKHDEVTSIADLMQDAGKDFSEEDIQDALRTLGEQQLLDKT